MKQTILVLAILLAVSFVLFGCTETKVTPDTNVPTNGTTNNGNTTGTTTDPITSQTTDATTDPADVNIGEIFE